MRCLVLRFKGIALVLITFIGLQPILIGRIAGIDIQAHLTGVQMVIFGKS